MVFPPSTTDHLFWDSAFTPRVEVIRKQLHRGAKDLKDVQSSPAQVYKQWDICPVFLKEFEKSATALYWFKVRFPSLMTAQLSIYWGGEEPYVICAACFLCLACSPTNHMKFSVSVSHTHQTSSADWFPVMITLKWNKHLKMPTNQSVPRNLLDLYFLPSFYNCLPWLISQHRIEVISFKESFFTFKFIIIDMMLLSDCTCTYLVYTII